jgi:hypothetical protein
MTLIPSGTLPRHAQMVAYVHIFSYRIWVIRATRKLREWPCQGAALWEALIWYSGMRRSDREESAD